MAIRNFFLPKILSLKTFLAILLVCLITYRTCFDSSCMYRTDKEDKEDKDMSYAEQLQYLMFLFDMMIFLYLASKGR